MKQQLLTIALNSIIINYWLIFACHTGKVEESRALESGHGECAAGEAVSCGVDLIVERDTGFVTDERDVLNHLKLMLSGSYVGDSDFDSDDDDSDDGMSMLACMM